MGDYTPHAVPPWGTPPPVGRKKSQKKIDLKYIFSETCTYGVYNPIRAQKKSIFFRELFFRGTTPPMQPPRGLHPPAVPLGDTPPCRAIFFLIFFRFEKTDFLKHAHMEFITRLGHFFWDFFGNFFWGTTPLQSPLGTTPGSPPWGTTPL